MNSQNRMNAGAEYVVYRIWATLQDRNGIHAESLLTCLGALAGYACQTCVRQTAALPGADLAKYALTPIDAGNGKTYLYGDALNESLVESRLSVWALISLAVRKLGAPVPDIEGIVSHVTQTVGTTAFGIPRAPEGHRPRLPPIVYLKQIWPQILPIAQRFCSKPAQVPVLFGIAVQRAIEQTKDLLSPTLSASIAMECAIAMSRVALHGAEPAPAVTRSTATAPRAAKRPSRSVELSAARSAVDAMFITAPARTRRRIDRVEASTPRIRTFVASLSPTVRFGAIASVAVIALAATMYKVDRTEARVVTAHEVRKLRVLDESAQSTQTTQEQPAPQVIDAPAAMPAPEENPVSESVPPPPEPSSDGSAEIVIPES